MGFGLQPAGSLIKPGGFANAMRGAWFAGRCDPVDPGGVATFGFVVRDGEHIRQRESGVVPDLPGTAVSADVAAYVAFLQLLAALEPDVPVRIEGDAKRPIMEVRHEWEPPPERAALRDRCAGLLADLAPGSRLVHIGRDRNAEAQTLARLAYVASMDADAALRERFASQLASPYQLEQARKAGHVVHAHMSVADVERLLRRRP